ncbi:MAG TPA: hypothetical protein IAC82_00920 [Candidatus Merdivicinus intestinigallinarum]|nr:hypothetical protein [Candidatus Merdivicinus intestinigallinarum]
MQEYSEQKPKIREQNSLFYLINLQSAEIFSMMKISKMIKMLVDTARVRGEAGCRIKSGFIAEIALKRLRWTLRKKCRLATAAGAVTNFQREAAAEIPSALPFRTIHGTLFARALF